MQYLTTWLSNLVKTIAVLLFLVNSEKAVSQQTNLTLEQANRVGLQNYPLIKQKDLVKQTADLGIENLNKGFLPQFSLSSQATYQSDVTKVDVPLPGIKIESPGKDQYKIVADVSQLIYDGGIIKQQKEFQQLNATVEQQKVEVELFKVKERINQLYLGVLYLDEQLKQVALVKQDIQTGIKKVEVQVQNGVALKSNSNVLKAELLKTDQRAIELTASRNGLIEMLSLFLNQPLNSNIIFEKPVVQGPVSEDEIDRPEIKLFADQNNLLNHQSKIIRAHNQPKANLFAQGGYGRPGLNLLKSGFAPYYIGGIRFNWALGGLYTRSREIQLVNINKKNVDVQKEAFILNTNIQLKQQKSEIDKLRQLILGDNEIIDLRVQVKNAANAQLQNGIITANDYLREINAEDQARQALITHELQLLQAQINYQTITGKQ